MATIFESVLATMETSRMPNVYPRWKLTSGISLHNPTKKRSGRKMHTNISRDCTIT